MKTFARLVLLVSATALFVGCASDWAARNQPVRFIPEIHKTIETASARPVLLSAAQREELLQSLQGPVRRDFVRNDLQPEVWASWWYQRDRVTFVRYTKDQRRYVFISYLPDGRLFGFGGGASGEPPWVK